MTPTLTPTPTSSGIVPLIPIITSGLTIYADVSKTASYPGTGTKWFNMVTGNTTGATFTNFTYQSGNGGFLTSTGSTTGQQIPFAYPTTAQVSGGTMTFGGWFRPYTAGTIIPFTRLVNLDGDSNYSNGLYVGTSGLGNQKIGGDLINASGSGFNTDATTNTGPTVTANNWYYIQYVWTNNTDYKIYVNGALAVTRTGIGAGLRTNTGGFNIGRQTTSYFKLSVSTFEYYNRALSGAEILANYNATKTRFGY
jgi:hypothetical protein